MITHLPRLLLFILLLAIATSARGQNIPKGFTVPDDSRSPDGHYGVTVPIRDEHPDDDDKARNSVIDMKSGRVLGAIHATTGWDHMNHGGVLPARWSPDGSLLLWTVDGKWFFSALVLLKIEKGQIAWQTDVLKAAQQAILARAKKAAPAKYAAAKKANAGNGSAYPEGFSVDAVVKGDIEFPLKVEVAMTSNPKGIPDEPTLESNMQAEVNERGQFVVTAFHLGPGHSERF
jgi:hypothetical protein